MTTPLPNETTILPLVYKKAINKVGINMNDFYRQIPGLPNIFPIPGGGGTSLPGFPSGLPGGLPSGWPGSNTGFPAPPTSTPGTGQPGSGSAPPPSQDAISTFQYLSQNPSQAQNFLTPGTWTGTGGATTFGVGCDGRWTIMRLRNGQIILMWVLNANAFGNTTGFLFPSFTFSSFPTSSIAAYKCY